MFGFLYVMIRTEKMQWKKYIPHCICKNNKTAVFWVVICMENTEQHVFYNAESRNFSSTYVYFLVNVPEIIFRPWAA
jgi:hypothetical protein